MPAEMDGDSLSGNPIITHIRSADPSAEVWEDGQVWIYASFDHDDAVDYSRMDRYHAFSSYDLVNWTDHGEIFHARDVSWGNPDRGWMFAPDAAFKDGTYYLYFPTLSNEWRWRIGVATSDRPEGPFKDIGRYIEGPDNIDPTCFMDDDGQAYLMWGGDGQVPMIARLRENMTELAEAPRPIDYGADNFGEGGYMHKRGGIYYFSYTCHTCWPYQGYYAMGDSPYGPFEYKGELNRNPPGAQDHHSMVEYHGQWYYFYHVGNYGTDGSLYRRNICIDSLHYNADGTMQEVQQTTVGVGIDRIGATAGEIVPGRVEAERYYRHEGVELELSGDTAGVVKGIDDGDWVEYVLEILGTETYRLGFKVSGVVTGTIVELYVDERLTDSLKLNPGELQVDTTLYLHRGKHTFRLVFRNPLNPENMMILDRMEFQGDTEYHSVTARATPGGTVTPSGITWYKAGDTASFLLVPDFNHVLDSLWIDDTLQDPADEFIFKNLTGNHTLLAHFSPCRMVSSEPYYTVDGSVEVRGTEVSVTEGAGVTLGVDHDGSLTVTWAGPGGITGTSDSIVLEKIRPSQGGTYTCTLVNGQGCITVHTFHLNVAYMELEVFEAESFISQSGIRFESCTDWGGGRYVGSIGNGDWCHYLVGIDEPGFYALTARVACGSGGGQMEISTRDSILGTITVSPDLTGSWENWTTTEPLEIPLGNGNQLLQFLFRGEGESLFHFNWFDLQYIRPLGPTSLKETTRLELYPNPAVYGTTIRFSLSAPSRVDLQVIAPSGSVISSLIPGEMIPAGTHTLHWNSMDGAERRLPPGVYVIRFRSNGAVITRKVLLTL